MAIIGGADGPTAIYLSGDPLMALIIPAVGIFAVGFAIGYFVKGKRKRTWWLAFGISGADFGFFENMVYWSQRHKKLANKEL